MDTSTTHPFTCLTCTLAFSTPQLHRSHYQSDLHRYNSKRRVAQLPAITQEVFDEKVGAATGAGNSAGGKSGKAVAGEVGVNEGGEKKERWECKPCNKSFSTQTTHSDHLKSKKHRQTIFKGAAQALSQSFSSDGTTANGVTPTTTTTTTTNGISSSTSTHSAAFLSTLTLDQLHSLRLQLHPPLPALCCPFCHPTVSFDPSNDQDKFNGFYNSEIVEKEKNRVLEKKQEKKISTQENGHDEEEEKKDLSSSSKEVVESVEDPLTPTPITLLLSHLSHSHSFFIPDSEYLTSPLGLLSKINELIGVWNVCLGCGKSFANVGGGGVVDYEKAEVEDVLKGEKKDKGDEKEGRKIADLSQKQRKRWERGLEAVRGHMKDKAHHYLSFETESSRAAYLEFYDYSSSWAEIDEARRKRKELERNDRRKDREERRKQKATRKEEREKEKLKMMEENGGVEVVETKEEEDIVEGGEGEGWEDLSSDASSSEVSSDTDSDDDLDGEYDDSDSDASSLDSLDEELLGQVTTGDSPYELVLPNSGKRIGHRKMKGVYKAAKSRARREEEEQKKKGKEAGDENEDKDLAGRLAQASLEGGSLIHAGGHKYSRGGKDNNVVKSVRNVADGTKTHLVPAKGLGGKYGKGNEMVEVKGGKGEAEKAVKPMKTFVRQRRQMEFDLAKGMRANHQKHYRDPLLQ